VLTLDDLGLDVTSKSRECVGFALLGYAHLVRMAGNLPSVTGAKCGVVLGDYTPAVGAGEDVL
jgi:1,6-anhydro-N-acetylmuramate kinase